jgi:hypothetical protein
MRCPSPRTQTVGRPPDTVVLVLVDRLSSTQRGALLDWVDAGGRLVVTDVASALHGGPAIEGGSQFELGDVPVPVGACTIAALDGLGPVEPGPSVRYALVPEAGRCFGTDTHAFVRADVRGSGVVVAVGGPEVFTNERLGDAGNAALAMALLTPRAGDRLVVLDGAPDPGDDAPTLLELVSPKVWQALAQLSLAFVVYALWRARRLGRPVADRQPVPVAGSDLVAAAGALLARGRHVGHAAATIRAELRRDARRSLGDLADEDLVAVIAARSQRPGPEVAQIVAGADPTTDDELLELSVAVEDLRSALGLRAPAPATPDRRILP